VSATRPPAYEERHAAPVEASRRGAHRARPNPLTSVIPVVAGMAVVVLVVVGAFTLLGDRGDSSGDPGGTQAGAQPSATSSSQGSAAPSTGASAPAATGSADPSASAGAGGDVDKTIELRVLNSISTSGLAKKYATQLQGDDWTVGTTGDSKQRNLAKTRVYYGKTAQKATADAVVTSLGFGESKKSAGNAGAGITVVLGQDADS
jgi:LytR cell envelope-related transcriptional attenuator